MKYPLFITQHGKLERERGSLFFVGHLVKRQIPLGQINEIHCLARVSLTSGAIDLLSERGIPVHFYTTRGDYKGSFINDASPRGKLHLAQAEHYLDPEKRLHLAREIVKGVQNTMAFTLSRWGINPVKLNSVNVDGNSVDEIMGKEAELWTHYYRYFGEAIGVDDFKRTRRPPEDEVNALISYANAVVYGLAFSSAVKAGLDPSIGYLHSVSDRRHSLPPDLADVFKPLYVFSTIKTALDEGLFKRSDFSKKGDAVYLSREGKKKFLSALTDTLRRTVYYKTLEEEHELPVYDGLRGQTAQEAPPRKGRIQGLQAVVEMRYYIVVYDVNEKRVEKVHKTLRSYLQWRQNSVFEGYLSENELAELKRKLNSIINEEEDSILFYSLPSDRVFRAFHLGKPPDRFENVI